MRKIIALIVVLMFCGCGRFANNDEKKGQQTRLVCIAKQYTEIIFALHAEQDIVAVDLSSTFPEAAKKLPTVGYHRALSAEAILAMKPTLILHDRNIGPDHVVKQLETLEVPMKSFGKYKDNIEGTDSLIREMGAYFGRSKEADSICKKLHLEIDLALQKRNAFKDTVEVLVIHFGQAHNVYLTMTQKSTAAKMIQWAGGKISIEGNKGMEQLSAELIAKSDPDVILLTDFGYDRLGNIDKIKELPGLAGTKAAKNNKIFRIEEHDLVYLGPRTGENVILLQGLLHK